MIKKIFRAFNCFIVNNIKFLIIKIFKFRKFKFNLINLISPFSSIDIQDNGKIKFGKMCSILSQSNLGVREHGILDIGKGVFINKNCHLIAHKRILIGENTCIGPNTIIMDHDHIFGPNGVEKKKFKSKEIVIGNNVWIGANCIILKGTIIGNNSVIAAGSVVNGIIPDGTILIQKRDTTVTKIKGDKYEK